VARVGGRYSDAWHVDHMSDPQSVVPESIMPKYAFLSDVTIDGKYVQDLLETHRMVGVPYTDEMIASAQADFTAQADPDSDWDDLVARYPKVVVSNFDGQPQLTEMDALIAYLQMLGTLVDVSTFTPDASR
jgi:cytochrome c oxidase cbb3-type subunit 2